MPVGGARTYAQIGDQEFVFKNWGKAVRAGKAFATSGSIPGLSVEGQPLGAQIQLPRDGGYLEAKTSANSLQSFHELRGVFNGEAVVREASGTGSQSIALYTKFPLDQINWVPAQFSSQHRVWHIWPGFMAAHTSPIYIQVDKNELFSSSEAMYMHTLLDGGLTWPDTLSIPADSSGQAKVSNVKMAQKSCTTDNITILNIV